MQNQNFNLKVSITGTFILEKLIQDFQVNLELMKKSGLDLSFKASQKPNKITTVFVFESPDGKFKSFLDEEDFFMAYSYGQDEKEINDASVFKFLSLIHENFCIIKNASFVNIEKSIFIIDNQNVELEMKNSLLPEKGDFVEIVKSYFKEYYYKGNLGYFGVKKLYRDDFDIKFQGKSLGEKKGVMNIFQYQFPNFDTPIEPDLLIDLCSHLIKEVDALGVKE